MYRQFISLIGGCLSKRELKVHYEHAEKILAMSEDRKLAASYFKKLEHSILKEAGETGHERLIRTLIFILSVTVCYLVCHGS